MELASSDEVEDVASLPSHCYQPSRYYQPSWRLNMKVVQAASGFI
jgi:hypothetical protein